MQRIFDLKDVTIFSKEEPTNNIFYEGKTFYLSVRGFEPGQSNPIHLHPDGQDIYIVLEGEGLYALGEDQFEKVKKGQVLIAGPGDVHGIKNKGNGRLSIFSVKTLPLVVKQLKELKYPD